MELAERCGLPVVTFVDVPGAHPGPESEERGIAEAIARSVGLMTRLRTPIVTVITGEGGSGGALAIAVGDVVLALENAVYSVISPEGCASILWRTTDEARDRGAGDAMSAVDQQRLGVIDEVIPEPADGAQADPAETGRRLKSAIIARAGPAGGHSARRAGRTALSPVPFARRVLRARGPGTDAADPARVPAWPSACANLLEAGPAGDPGTAPRRTARRATRPRGRLPHARPALPRRPNARPATGRPREPRPPLGVARARRWSRSSRRAASVSSRSARATGGSVSAARPRARPAPRDARTGRASARMQTATPAAAKPRRPRRSRPALDATSHVGSPPARGGRS